MQPALNRVEFRSGDDVLVARGQNLRNFILRRNDALRRGRMRGENLWNGARLLLFVRLNLFKEGNERVRIVAGLVHILEPEVIGFGLIHAREFQEGHGNSKVHALINRISGPGVRDKDRCHHRADLDDIALGSLLGAMSRAHMRDLMRHHSRQLGLLVRVQDQTAVDVKKSARQRERVHHVRIDHLDRKGHLRIGVANQVLPYAVHILGHDGIVNEFRLLLHFLRQLFSQRDFVFQRIEIQSVAYAAIADSVHILLGTCLDVRVRGHLLNR